MKIFSLAYEVAASIRECMRRAPSKAKEWKIGIFVPSEEFENILAEMNDMRFLQFNDKDALLESERIVTIKINGIEFFCIKKYD